MKKGGFCSERTGVVVFLYRLSVDNEPVPFSFFYAFKSYHSFPFCGISGRFCIKNHTNACRLKGNAYLCSRSQPVPYLRLSW